MTDAAIQKASLWREAWKAMKGSAPVLWPWVLAFGVCLAGFYFMQSRPSDFGLQLQNNPQLLQQHPEMMGQFIHEGSQSLLWFLPMLFLQSVAYYVLTVKYLQLAMKKNRPELSVNGYSYWFGQLFLKWLRGFWILLPIIGWFYFYPRAILRYEVVGPLAVLRRGDELKTSWGLTEDNCLRILGNSVVLALLLLWLPILIFVAIGMGSGIVAGVTHQHLAGSGGIYAILISSLQGLLGGLVLFMGVVFPCTCYRVLSQEAQQKPVLPQAQVTP